MKEYKLLKAVIIALVVEMVGFLILVSTGALSALNPKPFFIVSVIVGGFTFGIGMVLAGGCASGTTYRVGEGMVGSMFALAGYAFFAIMTKHGVFTDISNWFKSLGQVTVTDGGIYVGNTNPTLANIFGLNPWILVAIIAAIACVLLFWTSRKAGETVTMPKGVTEFKESIFNKGWNWWVTGIAIGIIGIIAFPLSAMTGRNYPLGITGGWISFGESLSQNETSLMSWEMFLVIGVVAGAAIAAIIAREFKLRAPKPRRILIQFGGGALMGFGAVVAGGCNIGHILSGIPQLAISSIIAGTFIVLGCWFAAYFMFMREKKV